MNTIMLFSHIDIFKASHYKNETNGTSSKNNGIHRKIISGDSVTLESPGQSSRDGNIHPSLRRVLQFHNTSSAVDVLLSNPAQFITIIKLSAYELHFKLYCTFISFRLLCIQNHLRKMTPVF